jgi:hypothetical protein
MTSELAQAIREACTKHGQSEGLARKIEAWVQAIVDGSVGVDDTQEGYRRVELLLDSTTLSQAELDAEGDNGN